MIAQAPSVTIRTRAGLKYGWGHLVRSQRLARHLQVSHPELSVRLAVEGDAGVRRVRKERNAQWFELSEDGGVYAEERWLDQLQSDIIVVDLIEISTPFLRLYRQRCRLLVAYADLAQAYVEPDIVICPQVLSSYPAPRAGQQWLAGPDYFVLDDSFEGLGDPSEVSPQVKNVIVVMGGAIFREAESWLEELVQGLERQTFDSQVVLGFDRTGTLKPPGPGAYRRVTFVESTCQIGRLMRQADLAIATGGYVKLELAAVGTPALLLSIVDHQHWLAEEFATRTGAARYLGPIRAVAPQDAIEAVRSLAEDVDARRTMSAAGTRVVDGRGIERIDRAIVAAWDASVHAVTQSRESHP